MKYRAKSHKSRTVGGFSCAHRFHDIISCHSFVAGLGEFKLRDLNDEINKLLREKGHWEDQILTLGGPDYRVWFSVSYQLPFI